ncbi:ATP-binding protein [Candidatus Parcubacteria bacterium]|nr:MAG: ATP-binding protein [Candidatus Parcubacteria bacterium]
MTQQVFVARERELSQLQSFLDGALAGHPPASPLQGGQRGVCFVTGEAGAGKTCPEPSRRAALVTEFARRAQAGHEGFLFPTQQEKFPIAWDI